MEPLFVADEAELSRIAALAFVALAVLAFLAALAFGDGLSNAAQRFAFGVVVMGVLGTVLMAIGTRRRRRRNVDQLPASAQIVSGRMAVVKEWRIGVEMCVVLLVWLVPANGSAADFAGFMLGIAGAYMVSPLLPSVRAERRERTVYRELGRWWRRPSYKVDSAVAPGGPASVAAAT